MLCRRRQAGRQAGRQARRAGRQARRAGRQASKQGCGEGFTSVPALPHPQHTQMHTHLELSSEVEW